MVDWKYSESIESADIVSIQKKYSNYIGGKFTEPKSKKYLNTVSPSTEEILAKVALSKNKMRVNFINRGKFFYDF